MKIHALSKTYQGSQVVSVDDLCLSSGLAHGLLGANGAGKTTLIKIMMGLVFADKGSLTQADDIALLPEHVYLPLQLTAYQMVEHGCRIQSSAAKVAALLGEVGLKEEAWHRPLKTYSKGMKQRAAIAYVLSGEPEWLILDEPMSGLDAMGRKHMLDVFSQRKQQGAGLLMCSHAITDLVRLCEQVHIMAAGKLCETVMIEQHSMAEVEMLESRLMFWSADHALV